MLIYAEEEEAVRKNRGLLVEKTLIKHAGNQSWRPQTPKLKDENYIGKSN